MSMVPLSIVRLAVVLLLVVGATSRAADPDNEKNAPPVVADPKHSVSFRLRLKPYVDAKTGEQHAVDDAALAKTEEMLSKRFASIGLKTAAFTKQPPDKLAVQADGLSLEQVAAVRKKVRAIPVLDFRLVNPESTLLLAKTEAKQAVLDPAWMVLPTTWDNEGNNKPGKLIVHRVPDITGDHIKSAVAAYDLEGWYLSIQFDKEAGEKFFDITKAMRVHVDRFAIVLDGQILSAPTTQVQGGIAGGACRITGKFTEVETCALASALMNPLQNPVVIEEETVK